jgi:hypothetical protein
MPFFHHDRDDAEAGPTSGGADPERYATALARYRSMTLAQRGDEVLAAINEVLTDGDHVYASAIVNSLLPGDFRAQWETLSDEQFKTGAELEYLLHDAFQALVLARLLIRRETPSKGATDIDYRLSEDGVTAVAAGDAAAVIERRLPA